METGSFGLVGNGCGEGLGGVGDNSMERRGFELVGNGCGEVSGKIADNLMEAQIFEPSAGAAFHSRGRDGF